MLGNFIKKHLSTIILSCVFLIGLCIFLYPTVSNWWNQRVQTRAIVNYDKEVGQTDEEAINKMFQEAEEYNKDLRKLDAPLVEHENISDYFSMLNPLDDAMMGYVVIPKLDVELPVYQGVSDSVLRSAVGHLPGTSLPVGGKGTHTVISAHRGLPSAKLFSDLDKMEVGDEFLIKVLNRTMTYRVDQIVIVEPDRLSDLAIKGKKDYATLMTCTPYGVNTHRLLVRGKRINESDDAAVYVTSDAYAVDSLILVPIIATPILIVLFIILMVRLKRNREEE